MLSVSFFDKISLPLDFSFPISFSYVFKILSVVSSSFNNLLCVLMHHFNSCLKFNDLRFEQPCHPSHLCHIASSRTSLVKLLVVSPALDTLHVAPPLGYCCGALKIKQNLVEVYSFILFSLGL